MAWWCGGKPHLLFGNRIMWVFALETRSLSLENGISSKPYRLLACSAPSAIVWEREWALGW